MALIDNSIATSLAALRRPQGETTTAAQGTGDVGVCGTWYARDLNVEVAYGDTWAEAAHNIAQARAAIGKAPYYGTPNADIRPIRNTQGELDYALTALGALAVCLAAGKTDLVVHQAAIYFAQYTHLPAAARPYYDQAEGIWDVGGLALAGLLPYATAEEAARHLPLDCPTHILDEYLRRHYTLSPHQMGLAAAVHGVALHAPHPGMEGTERKALWGVGAPAAPTAPHPKAPTPTPAAPQARPTPKAVPPRPATPKRQPVPAPQPQAAQAVPTQRKAPQPVPQGSGLSLAECLEALRKARRPDGTWTARSLYTDLGYSSWSNYTRIYKRVAVHPGLVEHTVNAAGKPDYTILNAEGLRAVAANARKHPALVEAVERHLAGVRG